MAEKDDEGDPASPDLPEELENALARFLTGTDRNNGVGRARYEAVAGRVQKLLADQRGGHDEIDTRSGETIRPLDPEAEKIKLEDIAHGLSNVGRFAGQGKEFYSVARHSVHVSREVEAQGSSVRAQRYALVHDAAEAYLSDVPGPVKKGLPGYKHAEKRLNAAIVAALGLSATDEARERVEEADTDVGEYELAAQFPNADHQRPDLLHDPDAGDAGENFKELFLERARDLGIP